MNTFKIVPIAFTLLILGCDDSKNQTTQDGRGFDPVRPNTHLALYDHQGTFTVPSTFSINSSESNFQCDSASLVVDQNYYPIGITRGFYSEDLGQIICSLSNLPEGNYETYNININFSSFDDDYQTIDNFTASFASSTLSVLDIGNAPVRDHTNKNIFTELNVASEDFIPAIYDSSGAAIGLAYILNKKFSLAPTEREVIEGLFEYGDQEAIQERRGFSLLDIIAYIESENKYAAGFEADTSIDISQLESETPFLAPFNINGYLSYYVVVDIDENFVTVIHPALGFMMIPTTEIENKNILNDDRFIVILFSETEFPTE